MIALAISLELWLTSTPFESLKVRETLSANQRASDELKRGREGLTASQARLRADEETLRLERVSLGGTSRAADGQCEWAIITLCRWTSILSVATLDSF